MPDTGERPNRSLRLFFVAMCVAAGVLAPAAALAHVKWFTDPAAHPLRLDLILSDRTLLWINSSVAGVIVLAGIRRVFGRRAGSDSPLLRRMARGAPTILAIQAAIGLVSAATRPALLAVNLPLPSSAIGLGLALAQVAIALAFITGVADWLGGLALIALVPLTALLASPFH